MVLRRNPNKDRVDKLRDAIVMLLVGFLLFIVVLTGVLIVVHNNDQSSRTRQTQHDAAVLLQARVEACKGYNKDQTRNRQHDHDFLVTLARLFSPGKVDALLVSPELVAFDAFSAAAYPYHDCSSSCVIAQFDQTIEDCPPAPTEDG